MNKLLIGFYVLPSLGKNEEPSMKLIRAGFMMVLAIWFSLQSIFWIVIFSIKRTTQLSDFEKAIALGIPILVILVCFSWIYHIGTKSRITKIEGELSVREESSYLKFSIIYFIIALILCLGLPVVL